MAPMTPAAVGPSNGLGSPCTSNTPKAAMPLMAPCPITAGHTLPLRNAAQPNSVPHPSVNHTIASMPSHGKPG